MNNLGRTDVERIVEEVLKNLSLSINPTLTNTLRIEELKYKNTVLSDARFTVDPEESSK